MRTVTKEIQVYTLEEVKDKAIEKNYYINVDHEWWGFVYDDCYEMPKEINSGVWPWRHMTIDYEAAAEEAKQDYMEVTLSGNTFFIRA